MLISKPFIACFLPDGMPDTSFKGTYGPAVDTGDQEGAATDFAVQADGRILAFGERPGAPHQPGRHPGSSFGNAGALAVPGSTGGQPPAAEGGFAVQSDGKLLAGGAVASGLDLDYWIGRFTP